MDKYLGSWERRLHDSSSTGSWCLPLWPQARSAGGSRRVLVPHFEGMVSEAACGCFEDTEEFHVRCREGYELHVRGRALHELSRVVNDTLRTSLSRPDPWCCRHSWRCTSRQTAAWRNCVLRSSPSSSGLSIKGGLPLPSVGFFRGSFQGESESSAATFYTVTDSSKFGGGHCCRGAGSENGAISAPSIRSRRG